MLLLCFLIPQQTGRSAALLSTKAVNGVNKGFEGFNGVAQPQMNPCTNGGLISDYGTIN